MAHLWVFRGGFGVFWGFGSVLREFGLLWGGLWVLNGLFFERGLGVWRDQVLGGFGVLKGLF